MSLQITPSVTITEPVTLALLHQRLKLTSTADDTQLSGIATQAREFAERISKRSLAYKSFAYTLDQFPYPGDPIRVPVPPLISLESITYYDTTLTQQTLDSDEYWVAAANLPALVALVPGPGAAWPIAGRVPGAITLTFTAGYGYPGQSTPTVISAGPPLPVSWLNNLVDIAVFMYENAGAPVPETLCQIPKIYLF